MGDVTGQSPSPQTSKTNLWRQLHFRPLADFEPEAQRAAVTQVLNKMAANLVAKLVTEFIGAGFLCLTVTLAAGQSMPLKGFSNDASILSSLN